MDQDALGIEVGLGPGHIVVDGEPAALSQKGGRAPPQFSAHFYCRQTAGCITMPLRMDVGLGPGDFVFDGDPATPRTEGTPTTTQFVVSCLLWPNSWVDEDATEYGSRPRPRPHCIRRGPSSARNGHSSLPPIFSARVCCGHGRPSQLLLSSCNACSRLATTDMGRKLGGAVPFLRMERWVPI